jgi:putative membrane protein
VSGDPVLAATLASWDARGDVLVVLATSAALYAVGRLRLGRRARPGGPFRALQMCCFGGALLAAGVALLSPLDALGALLLSAHMAQHEMLIMVAAPLLLLADPLPCMLWGLPRPARRAFGRLLAPGGAVRGALALLVRLPVAWVVSLAVSWGWHHPLAFEAALRNDLVHDLQHLSMFAAGLLFWFPVVCPAPRVRAPAPHALRIVYVLAALLLPSLPAMTIALLAQAPLYGYYTAAPRLWGLSALDDQRAGWALMTLWEGLTFLAAFSMLFHRMVDGEERRQVAREAALVAGDRP